MAAKKDNGSSVIGSAFLFLAMVFLVPLVAEIWKLMTPVWGGKQDLIFFAGMSGAILYLSAWAFCGHNPFRRPPG